MIARPFPGLGSRQLFGRARRAPSPLPAGAILTHLARTALAQAYRALGIGPGDEILIPAFHCGVEADAARFAGARVRFYPVTASLRTDPAAIASRMGEATRIVVAIHFYGLAQDLADVAGLCRARGAALIEDCAHVFVGAPRSAGAPGSPPPGSWGAAAVYSLPKFLPVPDGGVLALREGWPSSAAPPLLRPPPRTPLARRTARLMLDHMDESRPGLALAERVLLEPMRWASRPGGRAAGEERAAAGRYDPGSSVFDPAVADAGPSSWTRRVLVRVDFEEIARIRRRNYDYLARAVAGIGGASMLAPVFPDAAVPMVLPVRVADAGGVAERLLAQGVGTYRLGATPPPELAASEFPEALELRETLLGLPIHQNLAPAELDAIAVALARSVR